MVFCFLREISNGYFILEGKAKLSLQEAYRGVSYKYVVVQQNGKDLWECLIGFKSLVPGHVNRCLIIPEASIKANSKYKSLSVLVTPLMNSAYPKTHTNMVLSVKTC